MKLKATNVTQTENIPALMRISAVDMFYKEHTVHTHIIYTEHITITPEILLTHNLL